MTRPFAPWLLAGLLAVSAGLCTWAQAQDSAVTPSGWSEVALQSGQFERSSTPQWVQPLPIPTQGPEAPLYLPLQEQQFQIDEKAALTRYFHVAVAGTDAARLKNEGRQALSFNPAFEQLALHTLTVWRAGKAIDVRDSTTPRFLSADGAQSTVYGGQVTVLLEIADFRAGDQLEMAWSIRGNNPVFGTHVWQSLTWAGNVPVWSRRFSVRAHASARIHVDSLLNDNLAERTQAAAFKRTDTTRDGWQWTTFEGQRLPALSYEASAAPGTVQNNLVSLSNFKDWGEATVWARGLFEGHAEPTSPAYRSLLAEVKRQASPAEQVAYALRWVQREIRYASISLGENAFRPTPPDEVLQRRYGDCKDVALLLTRLLQDAGIPTQAALMNTENGPLVQRLQAVPWFNHAVAVAWVDGKPYALDGTLAEQTPRLERMTAWHAGSEVLVVAGPQAGFLRVPLPNPADALGIERHSHLLIRAGDLPARLSVTLVLTGAAAEQQRQQLRSVEPEKVKQGFLRELSKLYPGIMWSGEPEAQDEPADNRMTLRGRFELPNPLKRHPSGSWRYTYAQDEINERLVRRPGDLRNVPLGLSMDPQRAVVTTTLELPAGERIDDAAYDEHIDTPYFTARLQRQRIAPNKVTDRSEITVIQPRVPAGDIRTYNAAALRVLDADTALHVTR
jgi:hypothetical protein